MVGTRNKTLASKDKGGAESSPDSYDNIDDLFESEETWDALIKAGIHQIPPTGLRAGFVTLHIGLNECMDAYLKTRSGKPRSRRRTS
jgi:hypothetical protein